MMIGGIGAATVDEEGERCWVIATLELSCVELSLCLQKLGRGILNRRLWGQANDSCTLIRYHRPMSLKDDDIIRLIENFKFDAGPVAVERRNRGFTLIHAETGVPIARLRPIGRDDLVDILYWSLSKERWVPFGPFGRMAARVEQAASIIAEAAIFWAGV